MHDKAEPFTGVPQRFAHRSLSATAFASVKWDRGIAHNATENDERIASGRADQAHCA
jgi:hypothetical protein